MRARILDGNQCDLDLPLAAERVRLALPGTPRQLADATGLTLTRVAECLGLLARHGQARWLDDPEGQGPGVWEVTT